MCHGVVIAEPPDVKVKLADEMWDTLRTKGINQVWRCGYMCCNSCVRMLAGLKPEAHMYNILLHVYNANDHTFKPSEFVEEMQINNVSPNLVFLHHAHNL